MLCDLHSHSEFSDGAHPPEFLVERALAKGLDCLALTDHDCTTGLAQAARAAAGTGLRFISGVEISCGWDQREIHVVGLGIDPDNQELRKLLEEQQQRRRERMVEIDRLLEARGTVGLREYVEGLPTTSPGRNHVADFLTHTGACKKRSSAFRMLGRNGVLYSLPAWPALHVAVSALHEAGGLAVLAHPGVYGFGKARLKRLVSTFRQAGGDAMEVCYGNTDPLVVEKMAKLCLEHGLLASTGSDFHSAESTWTDIGRFPRLPAAYGERAIWLHPRWPCD